MLAFWNSILGRAEFKVRAKESVEDIQKGADGVFQIKTTLGIYRARAVVLALGRTGTPRKLGIQGEELSKVMYRLIEADHYINKKILVVGGGDSAIEAAMGLGSQKGNKVVLSYRKGSFTRLKERNASRLTECINAGTVQVVFNSSPREIKEDSVELDVNGELLEIRNDYVWIFAGGEPPNDFLRKIGVQFGEKDLTLEASQEAKQAILATS
ncbi:MAG: NAD(P)-binding domain-containing protein [Terriglobia bacterium]